MNYEVVFDVTKDGLRNWVTLLVPVAMFALLAIELFRKKPVSKAAKYATLTLVIFIGVLFSIGFYLIVGRFLEYSNKLKSGRYSVVEGLVSNYTVHEDSSPPEIETFSVGKKKFAYKKNPMNFSFDESGIIHDNLWVRIYYSDVYILKLEIVHNQSAP